MATLFGLYLSITLNFFPSCLNIFFSRRAIPFDRSQFSDNTKLFRRSFVNTAYTQRVRWKMSFVVKKTAKKFCKQIDNDSVCTI